MSCHVITSKPSARCCVDRWRSGIAGSIPAAALSSATLDKLFTHIVQRLWSYDLMALHRPKSV